MPLLLKSEYSEEGERKGESKNEKKETKKKRKGTEVPAHNQNCVCNAQAKKKVYMKKIIIFVFIIIFLCHGR